MTKSRSAMPVRGLWLAAISVAFVSLAFADDGTPPPTPAPAPDVAATSVGADEDGRRTVEVQYLTEPMLRNASLSNGGAQALSRAVELAARPLVSTLVERRGGWRIAARAGWLLWVELPIGKLAGTLDHEYGHLARLPEDASAGEVHLTGPDLPLLLVGGSATFRSPRPLTAGEQLAFQGGGWEADSLAREGLRSLLYEGERMSAFDALRYSLAKLNTSLYLLSDTTQDRLNPESEEDWQSDPLLYARWWSELEEGPSYSHATFERHARALHRGGYWNLVDYTLWATTLAWARGYVVRGERTQPAPWLRVGSIGLAPSASFVLTPIGPQLTLLSGWRAGGISGTAHVRWTDRVQGRRLVGAGGSWRASRPGRRLGVASFDVWREPSSSLGARVELGGEWRLRASDRVGLRWTLGAKSRGFLVGLPDRACAYGGLGLRASF